MKKKSGLIENRSRYGYVFILPILIGICLVFIPNLVQTIRYSVSSIDTAHGFALHYNGFESYREAIKSDPKFLPLLAAEFENLIVTVPVVLIYSLFISTLLNQEFKGRVIARVIFFVPVLLAAGVLAETDNVAMLYSGAGQVIDSGVSSGTSVLTDLTQLLSSLNFPQFLIGIITSSVDNIYVIAKTSGLQIFIFLAGLQEIPISVYEAAAIEGCSKWETFWKITLPMIVPQMIINAVYTIAISAASNNALLKYSNEIAFGESNYSLGTAMNVIYLIGLSVLIIVVMLGLKKFSMNTEG